MNTRGIFGLCLVLFLTGCKVQIDVPVGGDVISQSGKYECAATKTCVIEVSDTDFDEVFIAQPESDHLFSGWKAKNKGLCGRSLDDCWLSTENFFDNENLMAILLSDETFYLEPTFIEADDIRLYQKGDVIEFVGTLAEIDPFASERQSKVIARMEFLDNVYSFSDKNVLAVRLTVANAVTGEETISTTHFWQEMNGAFYDLNDEFGNYYMSAATMEFGVESTPSPLEPLATSEYHYFTMFGGHTSGAVTSGERLLTVEGLETVSVPLGDFSVYPVTQSDKYTYTASFADFKRDSSVIRDQTSWMSQVKGVIKKKDVVRFFSPSGKLEKTTILQLDARRTNF